MDMFIKLTSLGYKTSNNTTFFGSPKTAVINTILISWIITNNKGFTEISMNDWQKSVFIVKETPEEINKLCSEMQTK